MIDQFSPAAVIERWRVRAELAEAEIVSLKKQLRECFWNDKHGLERTDLGAIKDLIGFTDNPAAGVE